MDLYIIDDKGTAQRTEKFPVISVVIGNYVSNIFYVPDAEFDLAMKEIGQSKIRLDENQVIQDNEGIPIYSESGKVDVFLRPDSKRDKDRADFKRLKEAKARGNIADIIKRN